jgi:quercetin dioxygenase-like cupin family protein
MTSLKPARLALSLLALCTASIALPQSALAQTALPTTPPPPNDVKYGPPSHKDILLTTFVDWDALTVRVTPTGFQRSVFDNPTPTLEKFEVHITTLRPGMLSHAVHHHAWEEMLLVKEGDLESNINGKSQRAGPGSLILFASHDPHNTKNIGDKDATYYVMNFYTDLVHTVPDKSALDQAVPGMLGSSVIDCDAIAKTPTPTGSTCTAVDSPTLTFQNLSSHITTLNPGASKANITDSGDELFIVKSGQLEATVNGVTARLKEGSFFYCAPNDKRTLKNFGSTPLVYQVIKVVSDKTPKAGG